MKGKLVVLAIASVLMFGMTADAHHSFPATYSINKIITIQGSVTQLLFRNPHSFLQVDAPNVSGEVQRWSLEWGGATQLSSQGVVKDTLKVGDKLILTANPARSTESSTRALLKTARKTDGSWTWGLQPGQVVD